MSTLYPVLTAATLRIDPFLPLTGGNPTGSILSNSQIRASLLRSDTFNSYDNGYSLFLVDSGDGKTHFYGNGQGVLHLTSSKIEHRNGTTSQTFDCFHTYTDASNYQGMRVSHSADTSSISAITAGTGADDVDLAIVPAGAGLVKFGTHNAVVAELVTGYIEIKDASGTIRKLAVVS